MKTFEGRKDIPGYEGKYAVYPDGRIWSYPKRYRPNGSFLRCSSKGNTGYTMVYLGLGKIGSSKYTTLHRLIAKTFIPNPENKKEINHKNGIKTDNRVENLEWCTRSENAVHSHRILGNKGGQGNHKTIIKSIDEKGKEKIYSSVKLASEVNNIGYSSIIDVLNKRRNSVYKLKFFYV